MEIRNKNDLYEFLKADKFALKKNTKKPAFYGDEIWKFEISLRFCEYYKNCHPKSFLKYFWLYRYNKLSLKLGYEVPFNVFGKGLRINHKGLLIVNGAAKIGDYCDIGMGVIIGEKNALSPIIGNNVTIFPGAILIGNIKIGDNCIIGANALVNKSFESNSVLAGVPAKIIKTLD